MARLQLWRRLQGVFLRSHRWGTFPSLRAGSSTTTSGRGAHEDTKGNMILPGATLATLVMLGGLHARRLYEDKKAQQARQQGTEPEFAPDVKAAFLQVLPLRFISRAFGALTSIEIPSWARSHVYRAYCRAFHADLDEIAEDLNSYSSLQHFFGRKLKDGCRPIDTCSSALISPVDGVVLGFGQAKGSGLAIEQVKGHSYSVKHLVGAEPCNFLCSPPEVADAHTENTASKQDLLYCVLYLRPGDYHRVHSPTDWHVVYRRHFSGHLFPVNERATRTIQNLYVGNERVVLEGKCSQGYFALVAVGATNVGSITLAFEPDLKTNCWRASAFTSGTQDVMKYGKGSGYFLQKGDEVATFNLGSTVILLFQQGGKFRNGDQLLEDSSAFTFLVNRGQKVRMGQALGIWCE